MGAGDNARACTCIRVSRVCDGIRAPAPHQVSGLALRDVICEVYGHRGVEGHAVKGISVGPGHGESVADQPNPAARLHRGISVSIPIPDPLNRMDWPATRRIDSSPRGLRILLARSLNPYSLASKPLAVQVGKVKDPLENGRDGRKDVDSKMLRRARQKGSLSN